jgi:hypothetical protein
VSGGQNAGDSPNPALSTPSSVPRAPNAEPGAQNPVKPAREMSLNELFVFIDNSPKLRNLVLESPEDLKRSIPDNERLSAFFKGANPEAIIKAYQEYAAQAKKDGMTGNEDVKPASQMTLAELYEYIDSKPKLKKLMIEDPEGLKKLIPANARLKRFFEGSNVNAIIQAYQEHAKVHDGVRVTVEPDERPPDKPDEGHEHGLSRDEEAAAWEEVWDMRTSR